MLIHGELSLGHAAVAHPERLRTWQNHGITARCSWCRILEGFVQKEILELYAQLLFAQSCSRLLNHSHFLFVAPGLLYLQGRPPEQSAGRSWFELNFPSGEGLLSRLSTRSSGDGERSVGRKSRFAPSLVSFNVPVQQTHSGMGPPELNVSSKSYDPPTSWPSRV